MIMKTYKFIETDINGNELYNVEYKTFEKAADHAWKRLRIICALKLPFAVLVR